MNLAATMSLHAGSFLGPLNEIKSKMSEATGHIKSLGLAATGLGTAFAAFKSAEGVIEGFLGVFERGDQLVKLHRQTGQSIQNLVVLQKAYKTAGLDAEGMSRHIAQLQQSLGGVNEQGEPTKKIFDQLGLSVERLKEIPVIEQIKLIGQAIRDLSTPAEKTAATLAIFGRGSAQVMALLADPSALADATRSAGQLGAVYERNAAIFSKISVAFQSIQAKGKALFAGLAETVGPLLLPVLEKLSKLDFLKWGQQIGTAMEFLLDAFKKGNLAEVVGLALKIGFGEGVNWLTGALQAVVGTLSEGVGAIFNSSFFFGLVAGFEGVALKFGAILLKVFQEPILQLQAGMEWAVQQALEKLAKIPKLGDLLGIGEFKAQPFDTILKDRRESGINVFGAGVNDINARANDSLKLSGELLAPSLEALMQSFKSAIAKGIKPADIVDTQEWKDQFNKLLSDFAAAREKLRENTPEPTEKGERHFDTSGAVNASKIEGDRYAKIGLFVGQGGPAQDLAKRTADNTAKMAEYMRQLLMRPPNDLNDITANWA